MYPSIQVQTNLTASLMERQYGCVPEVLQEIPENYLDGRTLHRNCSGP